MQDVYNQALSHARQELDSARQELKAVTLRVSQLEAFVVQVEALITSTRPMPVSLFSGAASSPQLDHAPPDLKSSESPLWRAIIAGLNGKKSDFTVPDAIAALERTGRFINSPNKKAIVRNALKQRRDKFTKLPVVGHYCVTGFEAPHSEKEVPSEEKTS